MANETQNEYRAKFEAENAERRKTLEAAHGEVWNTDQLTEDFIVKSFLAPYVLVTRRSDGADGLLQFDHSPRFYYGFTKDEY